MANLSRHFLSPASHLAVQTHISYHNQSLDLFRYGTRRREERLMRLLARRALLGLESRLGEGRGIDCLTASLSKGRCPNGIQVMKNKQTESAILINPMKVWHAAPVLL